MRIIKIIKRNWIVISLILLALAVRVMGVSPGYTADHPDEVVSYEGALYMLTHFLQPNQFFYGAGMPFLHLLIYCIFIFPLVFFKIFFSDPKIILALFHLGPFDFFTQFRVLIFGYGDINAMYWSRYIAAVVGAGAVVLVYFTTRKLFNKQAGIFAAFFLAFNFRHVLASHFGLPDIHSSFFNILALYASVLLLEKNTRKRYIFAGIAAALALSMKYQPFAYLPFFTVHFLWALKKKSFWYLFHKDFILGMLASAVAFIIVNPYALFKVENIIFESKRNYRWYGMGVLWLRGYQYFYLFHWGIGQLPSIAVIVGIILMLFLRFRKFLVIFSFIFVFFYVMTYYSGAYPRNFTIAIPYLMIFAGFFMDVLYRALKRINIKLGIFLIIVILGIFNFSSIKNTIILDINYSKTWNIALLENWLSRNIPPGTTIRKYPILFTQQEQVALKSKSIKILEWDYLKGPNSLAEFQEEGTQFAILNTQAFQLATYWWRTWSDPERFLKFNNIPFDYIQNSFFGLSVRELMQYSIHEFYQPWQAQDMKNFLVFKIPNKPEELGKRISSFNFDKGDEGWKSINPFDFSPMVGGWIADMGMKAAGSLVIKSVGDRTQRLASGPIKVKPGMLYTVKAFLKAKKTETPEERDGYIRIDMYKSLTDANKNILGEAVAISPRVYETGEWMDESVSLVAPNNVKFLTISYQRKNSGISQGYLDDVELFETNFIPQEPFKELPYIKTTVPLESIYYNSFL